MNRNLLIYSLFIIAYIITACSNMNQMKEVLTFSEIDSDTRESVSFLFFPTPKSVKEVKHITYTTEKLGQFNKSITVYANAENSPIKIRIRGEVK